MESSRLQRHSDKPLVNGPLGIIWGPEDGAAVVVLRILRLRRRDWRAWPSAEHFQAPVTDPRDPSDNAEATIADRLLLAGPSDSLGVIRYSALRF
jgi:hypothetical protein